jgi:hypothetical protein
MFKTITEIAKLALIQYCKKKSTCKKTIGFFPSNLKFIKISLFKNIVLSTLFSKFFSINQQGTTVKKKKIELIYKTMETEN